MSTSQLVSREQNIAHVKVSLGADEVDGFFKQVYREYNRNLNIPGFRKGKVPENVIRQRVGMENIAGAVADQIKQTAIDEALDELKLTPRAGDTIWHSDPDPEPSTAVEYEFSLPVLPEVTLPDYRAFELTVPVIDITEEMKERFRRRLVERFTEFSDKDEPAQTGDALLVSFTSTDAESGESTTLAYNDLVFRLGQAGNFPGWDTVLDGSKAGDHHDFDFTVPDDFADPRAAGRPVKISLDVKSVHNVREPELNEAFVKEHVGVDTMEEFADHVDRMLHMERDQQTQQLKSDLVMQKLTAEQEAEITDDMVNTELDNIVKEYDAQLRQHGTNLAEYIKDKGQEMPEYRESLRPSAIQKIKQFLVIKTVAEDENISATGEDFQRYAYYLMQHEGVPAEQMKDLINNPEFMREATYQIVREKTLAHFAESAKFTEKAASDAAPETDTPATEAESTGTAVDEKAEEGDAGTQ